ncbi:MAG: propanediol dehydratase [Acidobacteria bacterium]|nr:MAG: propanediol dehydratase [Acidobacteriota bacterium]
MQISEELVRQIILDVLKQEQGEGKPAKRQDEQVPPLSFKELGPAKTGTDRNEVVIGVPPAFGTHMTKTIIDIPHREVLKELFAGIEEEGVKARLVRVNRTADVGAVAHDAAVLSGSGIGIGILCRGTTVIHQRDLEILQNLELFPQSPLVDKDALRAIGRNAAKYAKGEHPSPVPTRNDPMARPKYQGLAALLHNKETQYVKPGAPSTELSVQL